MTVVYVNFKDGTTRTIKYNPHNESPFIALQRVYRSDDDFMVYEVESITFGVE